MIDLSKESTKDSASPDDKVVTMTDVAKAAGVGVATVDRVINRRARVRPETAKKVLAAAEALGFVRTGLIKDRINDNTAGHRLGFLLQKTSEFYNELGQALSDATQTQTLSLGRCVVSFLDDLTPTSVVKALMSLSKKVDAIALVAADHPLISQAISDLRLRGIPTFALVSDLSSQDCAGFVSVDHRMMGRSAAWTMSQQLPAKSKIGLMIGSHRYLCQEQAEIGFRSYLREHAPQVHLLETLTNLEDHRLAENATLELLKQHPDLAGLYVAGSGIEGVVNALKEHPSTTTRPLTICHDLTPFSRAALINGQISMVLSHPNDWMATKLIDAMCTAIKQPQQHSRYQVLLPHVTYTAANV